LKKNVDQLYRSDFKNEKNDITIESKQFGSSDRVFVDSTGLRLLWVLNPSKIIKKNWMYL